MLECYLHSHAKNLSESRPPIDHSAYKGKHWGMLYSDLTPRKGGGGRGTGTGLLGREHQVQVSRSCIHMRCAAILVVPGSGAFHRLAVFVFVFQLRFV